jgi:fucose 4-O-acetylase-like acetyltransferase
MWLDIARGMGIVLVVVGHVERGLMRTGIAPGPAWTFLDSALYTFHMPLFMLLAGVNVPQSWRKGVARFLADKLRTVYHPYLVWSVLHGVILVLLAGSANGGATWSDIYQLPWRPMWHFWFLFALMLYLLLAAVAGMRRWLLTCAAIVALATSQQLEPGGSLVQRLLFFFPFFAIGVVWSQSILALRFPRPLRALALLSAGWALALLLLPWEIASPYMTPWALPAALLGSAAVFAAAQALSGKAAGWCELLGRWSLSIYVMHVIAAAATRIVLDRLVPGLPLGLHLLAGTVVGVAAPLLVHLAMMRLDLLAWFGLGRSRSTATVR